MRSTLFAVGWLGLALWASADTLVCHDGRRIEGQITKEGGTYTVKRGTLQFTIPAGEVAEWVKGPAKTSTPPQPKPQPAPARTVEPVVPPAPKPAVDPAKKAEVIAQRLRQAEDALAAGEFAAACARFLEVLDEDTRNLRALHGLALSHAGLGETAKAATVAERAMGAVKYANSRPDRALVLNYSMIMIARREPPRAIRVIQDYLKEHPTPLDEPMINALAVALYTTDRSARGSAAYVQAANDYMVWNAHLEAARAGERRWGVEWISQADFAQRDSQWQRTRAQMEDLAVRLDAAAAGLDRARANYNRVKNISIPGFGGPSYVANAQSAYNSARSSYDSALAACRNFRPQGEPPRFPTALATVSMDENSPPAAAAPAIAATSTPAEPVVRRMRRTVVEPPATKPPATPANEEAADAPFRLPEPAAPTLIVRRSEGKRTVVRNAMAVPVAPDLLLSSMDAVAGASEVRLEDMAGNTFSAQVVRSDPATGLVLLRAAGRKMGFVRVAEATKSGAVQCLSLAPSVFDLRAETITGGVRIAGKAAELTLSRLPRRNAAPLVAASVLVGMAMGERGVEASELDVVTAEQIRAFCGNDLPAADVYAMPDQAMCELTATVQVQ